MGINRLRDGDEVVPVAGGAAEERDDLGLGLAVLQFYLERLTGTRRRRKVRWA
jgi:hypothetical protein